MFVKVILVYFLTDYAIADGFHSTLSHLRTKTSNEVQANAAFDVIKRLIPDKASYFNIVINKHADQTGKDTFHLESNSGKINIVATSGVAAAWGFHHYLKYYCNAHVSWETTQLNLPNPLPEVNTTIVSNDRFRYYQNVCTTSYSFVWWSWADWEKHIDWMAMNSINLALAFNGQEAIWYKVYKKLNMTNEEIAEHFGGPAFLSWSRMGNLRGWGGPLSVNWHQRSLVLQKLILKRMRNLGIIPILPAFAGHVPVAFKRIFPNANMTRISPWNRFSDKYCCPYLLDPVDPIFKYVGNMFMNQQITEFGTDHVYNCDTFNEMAPETGDLDFLRNIGKSIFSAMTDVDPQAIWMIQNWLFVHEMTFWTKDRAEALLTSVPQGKMIVLDLQSEQFPQYTRLDSYFGQPFIWCMLHNFGGTLGMFGSAQKINTEVFDSRNYPNSTMIGTGITPEGINQNYVIYDLMLEMSWRDQPVNLTEWFERYASRRYGIADIAATKAWDILKDTVYNYNSLVRMRGKYVITRTPRLNINPWFWYDTKLFFEAWDNIIEASDNLRNNTGYKHDLVDVTRQALQVMADLLYPSIIKSFKNKKVAKFQNYKSQMSQLFVDLENILASNEAFLLGRWLESAKAMAVTMEETTLYEYNARNQITLWGPDGQIVNYANKQWAGIVSNFFQPRWELFLSAMNDSLVDMEPFNESSVLGRIFTEVEVPFTTDQNTYPTQATGDSVAIARDIHGRWSSKMKHRAAKQQQTKYQLRVQRSSEELDQIPEVIEI